MNCHSPLRYLFRLSMFAGLLASVASTPSQAGNPMVYGVGLCDPDASVYGDRVYIYCSHDPAMKDWWVWSSDNLVDWKQEGTLPLKDTFLDKYSAAGKKVSGCWATGGASRNGKYYWYYCSGDEIGVSVSDTPVGPWTDPLGKPLIALRDYPTGARDPDVLTDDDGQAYLIFGVHNYFIGRLNPDMISLAEKARPIEVINAQGPSGFGKLDDKPALHKYKGRYYLSYSSYYAVSDNIYGPYLYRGYVIDRENTTREFQIEVNLDRAGWRTSDEFIRHDRHGDFFQFNNQWYYECNDSTHLDGNRCAVMGYAHFRDNGDIAPVRIDRTGVGQYDALNRQTEAEDYFKATDAEVREGRSGGFVVQNITAASRLYYPRVMNLCANTSMNLRAASAEGGEIEVRENGPEGKVLGVCKVAPTGSLDTYKVFNFQLANTEGTTNLCMTFKAGSGQSGELMRLDWFGFPDSQACFLALERVPRGTKKLVRISAKGSSEAFDHKAENAIDGDASTFWTPADNQPLPQALTVDLGHVENIKKLRISQRPHSGWIYTKDYGVDYIRRCAISVSEDGNTFQKVTEAELPYDPMRKDVSFEPQNARYIKIEALEAHPTPGRRPGRVSIEDIQVVTTSPAQ